MKVSKTVLTILVVVLLSVGTLLLVPLFSVGTVRNGRNIHSAALWGDLKKVEELLKENPELVNAELWNGGTPPQEAADRGRKGVVEVLRKYGGTQ